MACIGKIKEIGRKKREDVNLVLDDVEEIGIGAISMLISLMQELGKKNIYFKGTKPKNEDVKDILEKSGFMNYVEGSINEKNKGTKNIIFTAGESDTHQKVLVTKIYEVNQTIWREARRRSPLLFGRISEMMKNSKKHAFESREEVRWHIAINHDEANKKVKFSFVDNGIGIIKHHKKGEIIKKTEQLFKDNSKMINLAFKKGLESKTKKSWRGTGLLTIYELFDDKIIKKLVVITNDAYCDFENDVNKNLSKPFFGTYYYWEMDTNCIKHNFTSDD